MRGMFSRSRVVAAAEALAGMALVGVLAPHALAANPTKPAPPGSSASTATPGTTPTPDPLAPPADQRLRARFSATGVQVYSCTSGAWTFVEPAAALYNAAGPAAVHFRGPSWESTRDGSLVEAKAIANSPVSGSIPQLLLQATKNRGDGLFGKVTYIQRLNTRGGAAPTGSCTDGATQGVRYSAEYRFYVPAS